MRLEYATIAWNLVEGAIAIGAAAAAGSIALLGFGIDSFVESASALVIVWRLGAERHAVDRSAVERLDRRAHRLVGASLLALAGYVVIEAVLTLLHGVRPRPSLVGIVLLLVSIVVMMWLARAKRRAAIELGSRAMEADSFQTTACWWLSIIGLCGIGLNAMLGWWWADPVAALGMSVLLVREGRAAWRGESCCD